MNFQQLLQQRDALLRQARLANAAYAYTRLGDFGTRITRARLQGLVALCPGDVAGAQPWPGLNALEGSQAVLDEHFLDEEVLELTDILGFLGVEIPPEGYRFRLEELAGRFRPVLRRELKAAGLMRAAGSCPAEENQRRQPGR